MHATLTNTGDCHMTRQLRWISINFLGSFHGAVCLASLCDASKKKVKERVLDVEAAAEIISFEEVTGV